MILYLKEIMKRKSVSSIELADILGVSKATVSYWLNGKTFPSPETLTNIADALGVELWELFKAPDSTPPLHSLTCPHCGKPIEIDIKKGSE